MKGSGFSARAAFMLLSFSSNKTSSSIPDNPRILEKCIFVGGVVMMIASGKLKENGYNPTTNKKLNVGQVMIPIDPVPSSKASIRTGPIKHGSPLIPYIPRPSPPGGHLKNGGST